MASNNTGNTHPLIAQETQFVAPTYAPLPVVLSHGEGAVVYDTDGRSYLDMTSAYSAVSHGHCHPELLIALTTQASRLAIQSRAFYSDQLAPFAEKLCMLSGFDQCIPMNTGAEAVETAIKCARRWGYQVKKIPKNKAEIIVAHQNFHGRTSNIVGFSSEADYRKDFGPFAPGFVPIPFADIAALEAAITPNTCAFLVEPMQGEGGINIPPKGWLTKVRALCSQHNVLLILDEIQTGLCRTGQWFAFQHDNIQPDGLILGKALGGGLLPVSAFLSTNEVMRLMGPGSHGSTFGGNPLGAAVGLKALEIMDRDSYAKRSEDMGLYMKQNLQQINSPLIRDIRGAGLWIGVDIDPQKENARTLCEALLDQGILAKDTHDTVVRFAPPLIITKEQIDVTIAAFNHILSKY